MNEQLQDQTEGTEPQSKEPQLHDEGVQAQANALSRLTMPSLATLAVTFWSELQAGGVTSVDPSVVSGIVSW